MADRVIISGGGTGGHIFPAIAIANALRHMQPDIEILFVGALGKMEMERVPAAGYEIVGLNIQGINRKSLLKNITLPFKLMGSLLEAKRVLRKFKPQVAIGVGGYASGPLLMMANRAGIPTLIQEQNSYAGLTNKKLAKKAEKICVAYDNMERFFPADRIILTGNPIRRNSVETEGKRDEACRYFDLNPDKKTVLITGGSLGARTLNLSLKEGINKLIDRGVQVLWQCGSYYYDTLFNEIGKSLPSSVKLMPFIEKINLAYTMSDLIVARAGAGTISELCVVGKPVILVPSPNVADDHQSKNAQSLVDKGAALIVKDDEAQDKLVSLMLEVLNDQKLAASLSKHIKEMALPDADVDIANEILKLIK